MTSESDALVLERYRVARDRVIQAIETGNQTVEIADADGRRRRVSDPVKMLEFLEQQIKRYEARVNAAAYGRATNLAQLHRR